MDANAELPVPTSQVLPAGAADALADGDQQTPLETRRQMEASNNPQSLEVVAQKDQKDHKDDKNDRNKEQEEKNTRQTLGADSDIEKMRLDFELAMVKHQHEENDKQRQHEERMEHIRHQFPSRTGARGEEEPHGARLDPITEIELEKLRMEFELAKLRHISEENEKQRDHERKMYADKEKQRQHEEKMEQMHQRQGNIRLVSQKVSTNGMAEALTKTQSGASAEMGKVRIELQLAMEVYLPEMEDKKKNHHCEQNSPQQTLKPEEHEESKPEAGKAQAPPEQQINGMTEHLGLYVPHIVVNGAESKWSSSRLDLAIETELEKRRMEFELARLKYEHEENERQRQHDEKMERLRQQGVLPREMDNWAPKQHPSKKKGRNTLELQLKKMRLKIKLIMIRYYYKDKEKQRQHKENMEEMRLLAKATQPSGRDHRLLILQDQLTLFLYCFIFIHITYIVKELVFFFIKKHVGH